MKSYAVVLKATFEKGDVLFTASIKAARNEKHASAQAVCRILEKYDCDLEVIKVVEASNDDLERKKECVLGAIKAATHLKHAVNSRDEEFREGSTVTYFGDGLRRFRGKVTEIVTDYKVKVQWSEPSDSIQAFEEETENLMVVNDV